MAEAIDRLLERGPALWTGLGRARQLGAAVVCLAVTGLLFLGSQWMLDSQYVPLFASLASEDAGAIIAQLKASKTPYRIGGTGEQILVPADKVAELRLRMAVQGLPLGGGVGFEVFDKTSFGVSDFSQRVNYQRALQGELARTIGQLRGVSRARVHLVMPQPSLFSDRERQPSASIFLKMAAGGRLAPEEVRGIVHLVASSVEGLSPERITLVDTAGRVLAAGSDGAASAGLSPRRIEIKTAVEEGLERRVQTLLDSALGVGQAVTRVTAQINFDQVERTEERFDQTPVARQETRTVETTNGSSQTPTSTPAPTPPVATPAPGAAPQAPAASTHSTTTTRETENVSYELSRIVAKTLTTPGEVQRLSMAVMLNTNTKTVQGPDKKEVREPAPRSPEELEKIRRIVMGAVGFNQARGDEVTVVEMPFDTTMRDRAQNALEHGEPAGPLGGLGGSTGGVAAVALAVVVAALGTWMLRQRSRRRALEDVARSLHMQGRRAGGGSADPAGARVPAFDESSMEGVPEEFARISKERDGVRQKAMGLASAEPEATAQLLRAWMVKKKALQPVGSSQHVG
jgi:flagellar M-ring protein FliF